MSFASRVLLQIQFENKVPDFTLRLVHNIFEKTMLLAVTDDTNENIWLVGGPGGAILVLTAAAVITIYYFFLKKEAKRPEILREQSLVEPGPERIRTSKLYKGKNDKVLQYLKEDVRTLYDSFHRGAILSNNGNCLGWRGGPNKTYIWQSYNDTLLRAKHFGSGLVNLGLPPGQTSVLGICLKNCPEWVMTELAAYTYSMVLVPLYDSMGSKACVHIMNQTKMTVVVCDDDAKADDFLNKTSYNLKIIIALKQITTLTREKAIQKKIDIYTFKEVEDLGARNPTVCVPPKPDDLCTICYTSGTTGVPKGVMLTHGNVIANIDDIGLQFNGHWINKDDVYFSFLPLAHMMERLVEHIAFSAGAAVGFYSGDLQMISEDIVCLKPTVMAAVPRFLNKICDKISENVSKSRIKELLFKIALKAKESEVKRGVIRNDSIWDRLVFRKVQNIMGGRLRIMIVSSAPLSESVQSFIQCVFGCQILVGYGQTETLAITTTLYGETVPGYVGAPLPFCRVKLVDVPEMQYYAANDQGEVCSRGPSTSKGYYMEPEKTKELFDEDGWLHTGDIGMWLPNGALKIIDRKKYIFKLSQGEYIAPEKIENVYARSHYVEQVVIHGESLKSCLVAIVVPSKEAIIDWALKNDIGGPFPSLCQDYRVKQAVLEEMLKCGRESDLKSFEQVKDIYLHPELFSGEDGLLTPTMKLRRRETIEKFKEQIVQMYKNLA